MEKTQAVLHEAEGFSSLLFPAFNPTAARGGNNLHAATQHSKGITLNTEER